MSKSPAKTYHIWTIGCQMNAADSQRLASELERAGLSAVDAIETADVVVLNTCVVKQRAEDRIYGRLGSLKTIKSKRPDLTIALMGCMVGMKEAPALRQRFPFVDVFLPPSDPEPLMAYLYHNGEDPEAVELRNRELQVRAQDGDFLLPAKDVGTAVKAFVPVVLGCSHACTFCVIPYRRGPERSRASADILAEIRSLVRQGIREVMLLGQIVDRFGLDLDEGTDLAELLGALNDVDGLHRIRFLTSHPNWMTDKLLDAVARLDKVCPHLEVPIQAANDDVLRRMRRGYTRADYMRLIGRIRQRIPDAAINTDIIVGFPGETEAQFEETCQLVEEVGFDKVHISTYSARPKTVATRTMDDDVAPEEKDRRRRHLDDIQREILTEMNQVYKSQVVQVLVEGQNKGRWFGRTPHNRLVYFPGDGDFLGEIVPVEIEWTGPFSLVGKAREMALVE